MGIGSCHDETPQDRLPVVSGHMVTVMSSADNFLALCVFVLPLSCIFFLLTVGSIVSFGFLISFFGCMFLLNFTARTGCREGLVGFVIMVKNMHRQLTKWNLGNGQRWA